MPDLDPELATINEAIYLRGLFIQRYSGIEFAVSELIMRARKHINYNGLGDLPFKWESKKKRLEKLVEVDGPIKDFEADFTPIFNDFNEFEAKRHFLVHAIMTISPNATDRTMLAFSMYDHLPVHVNGKRQSIVHAGRLEMNLEALGEFVASLEPISQKLTELVTRTCREIPLPKLTS